MKKNLARLLGLLLELLYGPLVNTSTLKGQSETFETNFQMSIFCKQFYLIRKHSLIKEIM